MSFSRLSKHRELSIIATLLAIFGVVKESQLRRLFQHLPDEAYGKILSRLRVEGIAYRSPDAQFVCSTKFAYQKADINACVSCFDAFILIKDHVQDFCAGDYPTLLSVATAEYDYDIIPVNESSAPSINNTGNEVPDQTIRYLVTSDLSLIKNIDLRLKNDYILLSKPNQDIKVFSMKGAH